MAKNRLKFEGALTQDARLILNHNFSDVSLCTTQLDKTSSTTLSNVAGMVTDTLGAGQIYKFRINLSGTATANGGWKVALKQNDGLTLTALECVARGMTATGLVVQHITSTTDAASLLASTTAIINGTLEGTFTVGVAGTVQLQFAQNASHADTSSIYINSTMVVDHITTG